MLYYHLADQMENAFRYALSSYKGHVFYLLKIRIIGIPYFHFLSSYQTFLTFHTVILSIAFPPL